MFFSASGSAPSVTAISMVRETSRPKKSVSPKGALLRAPRHRSMASRMVDLPLSPGPIRQFTPLDGVQSSVCIERKLRISRRRTRVIFSLSLSGKYPNAPQAVREMRG